jgi:ribosomal protein S18 acetylase RimI-like enzyme
MSEQAPSSWLIRPFEMADYETVFGLWCHAGEGVTLRPSDAREEVAKKLSRDPDLFLVAEVGGQVVGVIMGAWDGRRGWLHHLAVAEAFRHRGVASALVCHVEEGLRAKGCLKVNLLVRETNQAARQLYKCLGYAEMGEFLPMGKELQE